MRKSQDSCHVTPQEVCVAKKRKKDRRWRGVVVEVVRTGASKVQSEIPVPESREKGGRRK